LIGNASMLQNVTLFIGRVIFLEGTIHFTPFKLILITKVNLNFLAEKSERLKIHTYLKLTGHLSGQVGSITITFPGLFLAQP